MSTITNTSKSLNDTLAKVAMSVNDSCCRTEKAAPKVAYSFTIAVSIANVSRERAMD